MVHLEDAEATFFAVMGANRFPSLFSLAFGAVLDLHELTLEGCFHSFRHAAGVSKSSSEVRGDSQYTKTVKKQSMNNSTPSQWNSLNCLLVK